MLKYTYMPSVLIETGFLTNRNEGAYLNSIKGQKEMADAISKAIIRYKNDFYRTLTSSDQGDYVNYKIQVSASNRLIETKPYNFNGLESIEVIKDGNLYKYLYGNYNSLQEAKDKLTHVKKFGFNSSFVIALKTTESFH